MSDSLKSFKKLIEKNYGEGCAISAADVAGKKKWLIPVSPALDIGLLGGIPSGSWILISGKEKLGKTYLAMQIARNAQKQFNSPVVYINAEGRFKGQNTRAIHDLDLDNFIVVETSKDKVMYGEDFLGAAEEAVKSLYGCVIIIDSINRLYPNSLGDKEVSGSKRPGAPKMLSDFVSRMSGLVPARNCTIICIAQIYDNVTGYGAGKIVGGGNAVKFQGDVIIHGKSYKPWEEKTGTGTDAETFRIGNEIQWDVFQNAIGAPPSNLINGFLRFGYGADETKEILNLAIDLGFVEKKGSWFTLDGFRVQGEKGLYDYLKENQDKCDTLHQQIREMCLDPVLINTFGEADIESYNE